MNIENLIIVALKRFQCFLCSVCQSVTEKLKEWKTEVTQIQSLSSTDPSETGFPRDFSYHPSKPETEQRSSSNNHFLAFFRTKKERIKDGIKKALLTTMLMVWIVVGSLIELKAAPFIAFFFLQFPFSTDQWDRLVVRKRQVFSLDEIRQSRNKRGEILWSLSQGIRTAERF